jgi:hypothetical protein
MRKLLFAAAVAALCITPPAIAGRNSDGTITAMAPLECADANAVLSQGKTSNSIGISVQGAFTGHLRFRGTIDGVQFSRVRAIPLDGGATVSATISPGQWTVSGANLFQICVYATELSSGSAVITFDLSPAAPPQLVHLKAAGVPPDNSDVASVVTVRDTVRVVSGNPLAPRCNAVLKSNCQP